MCVVTYIVHKSPYTHINIVNYIIYYKTVLNIKRTCYKVVHVINTCQLVEVDGTTYYVNLNRLIIQTPG